MKHVSMLKKGWNSPFQRQGWESDAILNWLALAGWGTRHPEREEQAMSFGHHDAPDSTAIMSLEEIINEVNS